MMTAHVATLPAQKSPRQVKSSELFDQNERTVIITHGDKKYVLHITRFDKLILTK